jgi:integrase
MGTVYERGGIFWIKFYVNGKPSYESSKSSKKSIATRLLNVREGQREEGKLPSPKIEKTTFDDISKLYIQDYKLNERASLESAEIYAAKLALTFTGRKANSISSKDVLDLVEGMKVEGYANSSINKYTTALKRMFKLGQIHNLVLKIPNIPKLDENNVRKGFFSSDEFFTIRGKARDHVKVAATLAYWCGMRRGEILRLQWGAVDFERGMIGLDPGTTKNKEGRKVPMMGDLKEVLETWWMVSKAKYPGVNEVIHFRGKPVKSIKTAWKKACKDAGLPGKLLHDFRRTAVRNLVRAGVSEKTAMGISGHKTRAVFDRYDIQNENDLLEAAKKVNASVEKREVLT